MIKQRIARGTLLNRLRELEESQKNKQAIPVLFADVEEDGQFWVGKNISDKHYFENMFDGEAYMTALPGLQSRPKFLLTICFVGQRVYICPLIRFCTLWILKNALILSV